MITERNVSNLLIIKEVATTLTAGANIDAEIAGCTVGESVVTSPGGVIVDAAGTLPKQFKIGQVRANNTVLWSDIIDPKYVQSIDAFRTVAATQQLDYIGYNGTANALSVINDNIYTIRLYMIPTDTAGFSQQKVKRAIYKSDSTATQAEIAAGLTSNLITNLSKEPETVKYGTNNIKVERVSSGTSIATSGGTIAVSKGSAYVTILGTGADAGKYDTDGSTIVAGDYLRFGHATTKTYPVYKVESVVSGGGATTMVVKLDIPYQGTSDAAIAAASVGVIPAATALASDFGIKLTGSTFKFDVPKFGYYLPRWKTNLQDCGSTVITESAVALEGAGTYEQVAYMEQQFQGNEGNYYRAQVPYPTFRTDAVSGASYGMIVIKYFDRMTTTLGSQEDSLKTLYIACTETADATTFDDANTGLATTLQAYVTAYANISNNTAIAAEIKAG